MRPQRDYRLDFHGPSDPSCPSEAAFRADVSHLCSIREDAFDPVGRHVVRVIVRKGKLYEASMELFAPDGTPSPGTPMRYQANDCAQVMREVAVAAAAAIPLEGPARAAPAAPVCDEECPQRRVADAREEGRREGYEKGRLAGRREREGEMVDDMRNEIARQLRAMGLPAPPPPVDPPRMTFPFATSVGAVLSIGYGLDVAPGLVIGAEWRPVENFSVGMDLRALPPWNVWEGGEFEPNVPMKATMLSALVAPCARWKILMGCAVLDAGATHLNTEPERWWPRLAVGPRVGVDVPLAQRISFRVTGDLLFPLIQNYFLIDPTDKVPVDFEDPIVSGFVTAGLAVAF